MGSIKLPLTELIFIIKNNNFLPDKITDLSVTGDAIEIKYSTGLPIIGAVPLMIKFHSFHDGKAYFIIHHHGITDRILKGMKFKKIENVRIELPYIEIYVEKMLAEKVLGLEIANVEVRDGIILTETRTSKVGV